MRCCPAPRPRLPPVSRRRTAWSRPRTRRSTGPAPGPEEGAAAAALVCVALTLDGRHLAVGAAGHLVEQVGEHCRYPRVIDVLLAEIVAQQLLRAPALPARLRA